MRQHDLSFANFILRFGIEEVMIDYAEDIVIPAFLENSYVRTYGEDTTFRFYDVKLAKLDEENGTPLMALSGHFIKDTVLRRQQIFRRDHGLIEDADEIESAPSSFFILLLNIHRLLYFAETSGAPPLESFKTTAQHSLRLQHRKYIKQQHHDVNVTRRGVDRLTMDQLRRRVPPPTLSVIPVAGQDSITEVLHRFKIVKELRFKLIEPNDEIDASAAMAAVEKVIRPTEPRRLELIASGPKGLNKTEVEKVVSEVTEGHNTEVVVNGEDEVGLKLKADNDEFALTVPVPNPPTEDVKLRDLIYKIYKNLVAEGKVRRITTPSHIADKLAAILRLL